jgi:hypothetical protein
MFSGKRKGGEGIGRRRRRRREEKEYSSTAIAKRGLLRVVRGEMRERREHAGSLQWVEGEENGHSVEKGDTFLTKQMSDLT